MNFIKDNLTAFIGLLVPTGVILFALYQRMNSNSSASIINKIWSLLFGEKEYYNPVINSFSKQQHDIDKFNLAYGFRFNKTDQIERFIKWIEYHNFQIHWFSGLGFRFKSETFQFRPMRPIYKFLLTFQFLAITATLITLFALYKDENPSLNSDDNLSIFLYTIIFESLAAYYIILVRVYALYKSLSARKKMRSAILKKIKP